VSQGGSNKLLTGNSELKKIRFSSQQNKGEVIDNKTQRGRKVLYLKGELRKD
jgi:hypothetical protein